MNVVKRGLSRRALFKTLGLAASGIAAGRWLGPNAPMAQEPVSATRSQIW